MLTNVREIKEEVSKKERGRKERKEGRKAERERGREKSG